MCNIKSYQSLTLAPKIKINGKENKSEKEIEIKSIIFNSDIYHLSNYDEQYFSEAYNRRHYDNLPR